MISMLVKLFRLATNFVGGMKIGVQHRQFLPLMAEILRGGLPPGGLPVGCLHRRLGWNVSTCGTS